MSSSQDTVSYEGLRVHFLLVKKPAETEIFDTIDKDRYIFSQKRIAHVAFNEKVIDRIHYTAKAE